MKTTRASVLIIAAGVLGWSNPAGATTPPDLINYQGVLRDTNDTPRNGPFNMEFLLYAGPTGGSAILTDTHPSVPVANGLFSVQIGEFAVDGPSTGRYTSVAKVFRDYGTVYLEVRVNGETLSPRVLVVSTATSLNALYLKGQDVVTEGPLDLYVDDLDGHDANDGRTPETAKRTIQAAINAVPLLLAHPVTIHIAPGTYAEELVVNRSNTGMPFSEAGVGVTLLGDPDNPSAVNLTGLDLRRTGIQIAVGLVRIRGLRIVNFVDYGLEIIGPAVVSLEDCQVTGNLGGGVRIDGFLQALRSSFSGNGGAGIDIDDHGDFEADTVTVASNADVGVIFHSGSTGWLSHLTVMGHGIAMKLEGSASVVLREGVAFSSGTLGIEAWDGGTAHVDPGTSFSGLEFDMSAHRHSTIEGYGSGTCTADALSICQPAP